MLSENFVKSLVPALIVRQLGITDYTKSWREMQSFTASRTSKTPDEIWQTEHPPVFTLGLNRKEVRLPAQSPVNHVPVVNTDRGGKITYHGPGQVIIYLLLDLKRRQLNIRQLVSLIEASVITLLANHNIIAVARKDAPGVYVDGFKIASLGLRVKNHCCYHGLSLNINMDLAPFLAIDPCGYADLKMTQTNHLGVEQTSQDMGEQLLVILSGQLRKQLNMMENVA
ncbi:MAG: lipoyl(octanoyl) transferase LipB [Methylophilaceae bacterium]|nr:lipoyl(octanoyl) transferase LipB [Methylophilaceae bacterium]